MDLTFLFYALNKNVKSKKVAAYCFDIDILLHNNQKLTIGAIYRSPNQKSRANAQFIDTLSAILKPISLSKTPVMITGDLNYNLLDCENTNVNDLIDIMYENSFYPTITTPTRITCTSATVIDHVWTNMLPLNRKITTAIMVDCVADHLPVVLCAQVNCKIYQDNQAINRRRNYSNQNILNFMEELQSMETSTILSCTEANDAYTKFVSKYTEVFNICLPFRNQTKKHKTEKQFGMTPNYEKTTNLNNCCTKNV